jgi:hypothetical protein
MASGSVTSTDDPFSTHSIKNTRGNKPNQDRVGFMSLPAKFELADCQAALQLLLKATQSIIEKITFIGGKRRTVGAPPLPAWQLKAWRLCLVI